MKKPILVLVDGSAVFHRGFHAIPPLTNKEGLPTNAVFGFATIFLKVLQELKPTYAVITWDKSSKTFRKEMYAEYKATRAKTPEELKAQVPTLKEFVAALKLPFVELEGFEADDIIGTLAKQAEDKGGLETIIVTGDLDELQLVDHNTRVYTMKRGFTDTVIYDIEAVKERYGVTPYQFIDLKALKGDASDNIPGVPGIGEKSAMDLMAKYGSLDSIYEHIDELKGAQKEKLAAGKDSAYLSQKLSAIVRDAPTKLDLEHSKVGMYDRSELHDLLRRLEFKSLLTKLPPEMQYEPLPTLFASADVAPERPHLKEAKYHCVTDLKALETLAAELRAATTFALDTETDSVDTTVANLVGLSVCFKEGEAYYIPVGHKQGTQLALADIIRVLGPVLESADSRIVGHNIKFDIEVLARAGVRVTSIAFDTMVAAFLLNSLGRAQSLDDLAYGELGIEMIPITELIGNGKTQTTFDHASVEEATTYAAEDADMSWRLFNRLSAQLEAADKPNKWGWTVARLGSEIEWPVIPVLADMEIAGIKLDTMRLSEYGKELAEQLATLTDEIYAHAGEAFNLGSPSQLSQILYGRLKLPTAGLKKGKTGYSTAAAELEKLKGEHPVIELIMQYRELDKLRNTYVDALPGAVKADGRIHTSFNQTIAQTGRLSSTNPNLQNIPVRTETGRHIRAAFVAPVGRQLVSADYSQIELRVAAALSGDAAMTETFTAGLDLHLETAAELYSLPADQISKEQRYAAKTINFGVLYGMSAHGLSVATGMDQKEAVLFIERYFAARPQLKAYIDETKKFAYDNQYTATLFGRRRPCPEIRSSNFQIRQAAERMAVNVPIQGTAADIYKLAMIDVAKELQPEWKLLLQIHDELILEVPEDDAEKAADLVKGIMAHTIDIGVPLAVDTAWGKDWGEL